MKKAFLSEIQAVLEEEKKKLEQELSRFAHRNPKATQADYDADHPDYGNDDDDNAREIATYSNNLSLENELEKALRDVDNALKRIAEEGYGVCKYCKTGISEARLKARPTASSCIACKKTLTQEI